MIKSNLTLKFIYALYNNPIYKNCDYDEAGNVKAVSDFKENIDIAIVGFGDYGRTFLDMVLQIGQMPGRKLNVSVYSGNMAAEKQTYLADRPAFEKFFDVDDNSTEDSYGHIYFKQSKWKEKDKTTVEFFDELAEMDYVLFTEDSEENIAKSVGELLKENPLKYKPVLVKAEYVEKFGELENHTDFSELERMAFNAHLVWKKSLEINIDEAYEEFREEYNYLSCLTNVLSIKYKLHSSGIEFNLNDAGPAAKTFTEKLKDKKLIDELSDFEHRRWNTDKICSGWQPLSLDDISDDDNHNKGKTNDEFKKHHYCLVKSNVGNPLADWSANDWDNRSIDELDDLDKVSVITHRILLEKAKEKEVEILLSLGILRQDIKKEYKSVFEDWSTCISLIIDRNAKKICKPYFNAYNRLLNSTTDDTVKSKVKKINSDFYSFIKCREYDNQKQKDIDLVKQIPFILTYNKDVKLACEFTTGDNSKLFSNVSVLKKFNPAEMVYFCEYRSDIEKGIKHFNDCIDDYSWLRTKITFVIGCNSEKSEQVEKMTDRVKISADVLDEAEYYDYIINKIGGCVDFVLYSTPVLGYVLKSNNIACGKYNGKTGKCDTQSDISLCSVSFDLNMTIQDILRINGAKGCKQDVPIHLEKAYKIYSENELSKSNWKKLCGKLKNIVKKNKNEMVFCIENLYRVKGYKNILDKLGDKEINFIRLIDIDGMKHIEFFDDSVKSLLTKEGEMLEVHIYNICVASGLFDDIATGYEIEWESGNVTNEFDLLATFGLKSLFAEIKATSDYKDDEKWVNGLKQEYYEKLESLDCKFGINSSEFIINDSADINNDANKKQISRGKQFGIRTITKAEIENTPNKISNPQINPRL